MVTMITLLAILLILWSFIGGGIFTSSRSPYGESFNSDPSTVKGLINVILGGPIVWIAVIIISLRKK